MIATSKHHLAKLLSTMVETERALGALKKSLVEQELVSLTRRQKRLAKQLKTGRPRTNLLGKRFGSLTVVRDVGTNETGALLLAKCVCGNTPLVSSFKLLNGHITSCASCAK